MFSTKNSGVPNFTSRLHNKTTTVHTLTGEVSSEKRSKYMEAKVTHSVATVAHKVTVKKLHQFYIKEHTVAACIACTPDGNVLVAEK